MNIPVTIEFDKEYIDDEIDFESKLNFFSHIWFLVLRQSIFHQNHNNQLSYEGLLTVIKTANSMGNLRYLNQSFKKSKIFFSSWTN